jgi:hypothetical protein
MFSSPDEKVMEWAPIPNIKVAFEIEDWPDARKGKKLLIEYGDGAFESRKDLKVIRNFRFVATLQFLDYSRGRSSAKINLEDEFGTRYGMFLTDLLDVLRNCRIENGSVTATWTFQKRGMNYGIRLARLKDGSIPKE